jgi:hypothetical protein
MRFYKKIKQLLFFFMCALMAQSAYANSTSLTIRTAELVAVDDGYVLNADVDMKFSAKVEEAISKGFVLNFLVEFQLAKPRKYWFDDEVVTVVHALALSYHALSRQYLVTRGDQQKAFVRLDEALDDLSDISGLKVLKKSEVDLDEAYKAAILMRLDTKKLSQALQGVANDGDWGMRSQRFEWAPNFTHHPAKTEIKLELAK